jgi:apolipoprotein N-acyltransferase
VRIFFDPKPGRNFPLPGDKLAAMQDVLSTVAPKRQLSLGLLISRIRVEAPSLSECSAALLSAVLLILSFPDFNLWPLAWFGLSPLLLVITRRPAPLRAFSLGLLAGTVFFYGSCYWLTYSMIHFGRLPGWLAYTLLVPGAVVVGLFPAVFALILALSVRRWRNKALFLAPLIWVASEWARLEVSGQLWNALGYSQAYQPILIQLARWGGVYAVSFAVLAINSAIAFVILNRCKRNLTISLSVGGLVALGVFASFASSRTNARGPEPELMVIAIQPNVPMDPTITTDELKQLTAQHITESEKVLRQLPNDKPRLVIWPESPMNFTYGSDPQFQNLVGQFTKQHHTALLFNSQEAAPGKGSYNSAVLVNEEGRAIAQYDKIRLLPFGEYVPLPRWVPGASLITAIVGDFTPGDKFTLMSAGPVRAGVFICIESAYPWIARTFAAEGADVLINISNDGYLGPTAVMRQHLANAIFRAVENGRPVLRVTNSGITAYITPTGDVLDESRGFERAVRNWTISSNHRGKTFYTRFGDTFAGLCALLTVAIFALTLGKPNKELRG